MLPRRARISPIVCLAWLCAIALATTLDSTFAAYARSSGAETFLQAHTLIRAILKAPGVFWFTIPVAIAVFLLQPLTWRASILLLLGNAIIAFGDVIKWMVGRTRPYKLHDNVLEPFAFQPFRGGLRGVFDSRNLCFPSGHAALAFATAAALGILLPKWRWAFFAGAACVAAERISENAHWFSDTVGAAAFGIGAVWIVRRFWWDKQVQFRPPDQKNRLLSDIAHG